MSFFFFLLHLLKVEDSQRIQSTDVIPLKKDVDSVPPVQDMTLDSVTCSSKCSHLLAVYSEQAHKDKTAAMSL